MTPLMEDQVGDFKPGSIKRLRLHNFLTYGDVEFKPGPRLNVVCGPNGTGKSTLLCAICLGLGGEPKTLGRADDTRLFIMHEKDMAMIEIELHPLPNGTTHIIRRVIDRSKGSENGKGRGASSFFINGEKASINDVRSLVADKYYISIDNLCTFLPQDRVGNFSSFTSQALLVETEKSLAKEGNLYRTHQQLIELESKLQDGNSEVETLQSRLKQLQEENERLEREKQRMEERERALEQAQLYHKKLLWLYFDEARDLAVELKATRMEARNKAKDAQSHVKPLEEKQGILVSQKKQAEDRYLAQDKNVKNIEKNMMKQIEKHEKHDDGIEDLLAKINSLQSSKARRLQEVQNAKQRVENLQATFGELNKEEIELKLDEAIQAKKAFSPEYDKAKRSLNENKNQLRDADESARRFQEKLGKLNDDKARRNERIFRTETNLRQICDWLDKNRDRFRRQVWGPIVCEVTTTSQNAAAFLEQHVPKAVLKSFVVECSEDMDLLYKLVRHELRLPINIQKIPNGKLEPTIRKYTDRKLMMLKKEHGVTGFLDESFTAPDPIMQALRNSAQVQDVLVGDLTTQRSINDKNLLGKLAEPDPELRQTKPLNVCIFASTRDKSFKYVSSISRYSNKAVIRVDEINSAKLLAPGVDPSLKAATEQELRQAHETIDKLRSAMQQSEEAFNQLQTQGHQLNACMKEAKLKKGDFEKLAIKINNAKRKLHEAEEAESNAQDEDERRQLSQSLKNRLANSITALESHADFHKQLMQATVGMAAARINKECLAVAERKAAELLDEKKQELTELEREFSIVAEKFAKARNDAERFKTEADREAPLLDNNGAELPLKAQLDELAVNTKEEAEAALEEATTKANSIVANPDVIRQYEERKEEIETLKQKVDVLQGSKESKVQELVRIREPWEAALLQYVNKVNALFSGYMQELGCAGEVHLTKGCSEDVNSRNFKEWGIEIRVKFREKRKLEVLSAQVHSGGERSVSTIMYLMALQELMVSPFRCVDEINQGLDERNERLVFKRIVANSTAAPDRSLAKHSGQYFLITPKLLPNLTDMEVEATTVLIIFNGPQSFESPTDWDIQKLIGFNETSAPVTEGKENYAENVMPEPRVTKKLKAKN